MPIKIRVRQLSPSTNLVLSVLAGLGLLGSLSLPWFAAPVADPATVDGPMESGAFKFGQVFATSAKGTVSGSDALGSARVALAAIVVLVTLVVLAVGTPSLRRQAEDLMRVVVFAVPVVVVVAAVAHPGTDAPVWVHYGLLVSFALVAVMCSAAWHGANMRQKRTAPVRPRYGSAR